MLQVQIQTATADKQAYIRNAQKILEKLKSNDMELIEATLEYALQIFKSNEQPLKKLLVLRLIKDAIVIKSPKLINKYIQNRELMKKIADYCQHKLGDSNPNRGQDLFQGQDPQSSSEFLRTVLELTEHLATTFPKDNKGAPTKFKIQYDELIEMGVKFPPRSHLMDPFDPQKEEQQISQISQVIDRKEIDRTMQELNKTKQTIYEDITMINETLENETDMTYINEVLVTYSESMSVTQQTFDPLVYKARSYDGVLNEDEVSELYTLQQFVIKFQKFYNTYLQKICTPEAYKELKIKTLEFIKKILSKDFDNAPPLQQQQVKQQRKQQNKPQDEDDELQRAIKESQIVFQQQQQKQQQQSQIEQQKKQKEQEEQQRLQQIKLEEERKREQERIELERQKAQEKKIEQERIQISQEQIRQQELLRQKQVEEQQRQERIKLEAQQREQEQKKQKEIEQYWNNPFGQQQQQQQQNNSYLNYQTPENDDQFRNQSQLSQQQNIQKQPYQIQQTQSYLNGRSQQIDSQLQSNQLINKNNQNPNQFQAFQFENINSSLLAQQPNNQQYLTSQYQQPLGTPQGFNQSGNFQGGNQYLQSQFRETPMNQTHNSGTQKKFDKFEENFDNLSVSTSTKPQYPLKMEQQIQIKQYTGKLVRYDNTQFDILHTYGLSDSQKKRFKLATLKGKAALVNSPQVQIGIIQSLYYVALKEKNYLKLQLYIGNKTQSPIENCKLNYEGDNKQFLLWLKPDKIQERIEPGLQISQEIICIFKQHENYRLVNVNFQGQWANKSISTNFFLTTTLVSFMDFKDINLQTFRMKWRQKKSGIFKSETFLLNPKIIKTGYYLKKLFPKLCEYSPFQKFQDQQLDYFNDRQLKYISYKLCGIFELTNVNQNYMIKFIILPNMNCTIQIIGDNQHLCRQMLSTLNWILGLE